VRIGDAANINEAAELLRSFQPPSNLRDTDENDVSVKTAATFKRYHAVAVQLTTALQSSDAFPDVCN
jgi:hypothetical protein